MVALVIWWRRAPIGRRNHATPIEAARCVVVCPAIAALAVEVDAVVGAEVAVVVVAGVVGVVVVVVAVVVVVVVAMNDTNQTPTAITPCLNRRHRHPPHFRRFTQSIRNVHNSSYVIHLHFHTDCVPTAYSTLIALLLALPPLNLTALHILIPRRILNPC